MEFNEKNVRAMQDGDVYRDHLVKGLQLRKRADVWSWQLYYRFKGAERRPKIGDWPSFNLSDARDVARALRKQIQEGADVSAVRQEERAAPTVADLGRLYLAHLSERVSAGALRPRTFVEYRRHVGTHLRPIQAMKVADVTFIHVDDLLSRISAKHPTNANRVRATLSSMFKFAEHPARALRPAGSNPVRGTIQRLEAKRKRFATPEECVALSKALADLRAAYPAHVAAILSILYSGTRVTELLKAKRHQLNGDTIILDQHKTMRTGHDRVIHLPRQAVDLIATLPKGSLYVFGDDLAGQKDPRFSVFRVWEMARETAGCPDLRVMDLRRTFASVAKSSGVALSQIGEIFGHRDTDTTQRYAYLFPGSAKQLVQATADTLEAYMRGDAASVTRFRRRRLRVEFGAGMRKSGMNSA